MVNWKDKEEVKEYYKQYGEKNRIKLKEYHENWRGKNRKRVRGYYNKEKQKQWREKNKEKIRKYYEEYCQQKKKKLKEWRVKNKKRPEIKKRNAELARKYRKKFPIKHKARDRTKSTFNKLNWDKKDYCLECGKYMDLEIHHISYKPNIAIFGFCNECHNKIGGEIYG